MQSCALSNKQMEDLLLRLRRLPDVRKPRGIRHPYFSVLTIAIAALLGGGKTYASLAEWAGRLTQNQLKRLRARFYKKRQRFVPPSEPTIRRVLQSADVESVEHCLGKWLLNITDDTAIAIDGKTLKGAKRDNGPQVHLLSAFLHNVAVTVSQLEVDEKTSTETVYGITPLPLEKAGTQKLLALSRGHWSIENRSHYVRDMVYDEDRHQVRKNKGPHMMACLRNFAISLLRLMQFTNIAKATREIAAWADRLMVASQQQ